MIAESLLRRMPILENFYWVNKTRQDYEASVATQQSRVSLREKAFVPMAITADFLLPGTSKVLRLVTDDIINDPLKILAALGMGLAIDIASGVTLWALHKEFPRELGFARRWGAVAGGKLALNIIAHSAIGIIETRVQAAHIKERAVLK